MRHSLLSCLSPQQHKCVHCFNDCLLFKCSVNRLCSELLKCGNKMQFYFTLLPHYAVSEMSQHVSANSNQFPTLTEGWRKNCYSHSSSWNAAIGSLLAYIPLEIRVVAVQNLSLSRNQNRQSPIFLPTRACVFQGTYSNLLQWSGWTFLSWNSSILCIFTEYKWCSTCNNQPFHYHSYGQI